MYQGLCLFIDCPVQVQNRDSCVCKFLLYTLGFNLLSKVWIQLMSVLRVLDV